MIIVGGRRLAIVLIIRGQLVVKLNEALVPGHLRALVMTKFRPVFRCGVLNMYLVILLIKYSINGDVSEPTGSENELPSMDHRLPPISPL